MDLTYDKSINAVKTKLKPVANKAACRSPEKGNSFRYPVTAGFRRTGDALLSGLGMITAALVAFATGYVKRQFARLEAKIDAILNKSEQSGVPRDRGSGPR